MGDVAVQLFPHRAGAALQPEAVDAFCQHAVLCRLGDAQVELFVAAVVGDAVAYFLFLDLQDALQRFDVGFGDGQRGDFGDAAFQHLSRLHQLKRADVAVVGFCRAIVGQADDIDARPLPYFNEALDFQHDQRFAQQRAADVKLFGKLAFGGHFVANGKAAALDDLPQFGGNFGITAAGSNLGHGCRSDVVFCAAQVGDEQRVVGTHPRDERFAALGGRLLVEPVHIVRRAGKLANHFAIGTGG